MLERVEAELRCERWNVFLFGRAPRDDGIAVEAAHAHRCASCSRTSRKRWHRAPPPESSSRAAAFEYATRCPASTSRTASGVAAGVVSSSNPSDSHRSAARAADRPLVVEPLHARHFIAFRRGQAHAEIRITERAQPILQPIKRLRHVPRIHRALQSTNGIVTSIAAPIRDPGIPSARRVQGEKDDTKR